MSTINLLTALDAFQSGDQLAAFDTSNGDARRGSISLLQTYLQNNLDFTDVGNIDLANLTYNQGATDAQDRTLKSRLQDRISVKDFGATGDGSTDDTDSIQNALDYALSSGRRGVVFMPPGEYRTTGTITVSGTGVRLEGEMGEFSTIITADHKTGPVVRVKDRRSGISNLEISASATRTAGPLGSNYGVWIESDDSAGFRPTYGKYENVIIHDQPNTGMLIISACWFSRFTNVQIYDCAGHGMQFDYGSETGRSVTENPGEVLIDRCQIYSCAGNGLIIGNDDNQSNRGFRFDIRNLDLFYNAEAAGVRRSADQMWAFMDTSSMFISALDGADQADTASTTRGLFLAGRANIIGNTRFLNVTPAAMRIADIGVGGYTTEGITIRDFVLFGSHQASLDPVITLDSGISGITIDSRTKANVTSLTAVNQSDPALTKAPVVVYKTATETVNNSNTLQDDDELAIELLPSERAQFKFNLLYRGNATADIKFGLSIPAGATINFCTENGTKINTADTIAIQNVIFSTSSTIQLGTDPSNTRQATIVGEIRTNGTGGDLQLQWAQNVATVADTDVLAQSHLIVWR